MTDDEEIDDEAVKGKEQVNDDEDEEMTNDEVEESRNGDEEDTDTAKPDAENTKEAKDDSKKAELPLTSSNLSVSSDAEISSLLDIKIQYEVPHIQSSSILKVLVSVISEPPVLTPVQEIPSATPVITLPPPPVSTIPPAPLQQTTTPIPSPPITTDAPTITIVVPTSDALFTVQLRVVKLEKDVSELKKIDHSAKDLATLKSQVLMLPSQARSRLQQLTLNKNLRKVLKRFSRLRRNKLRSKRCQSILLSFQTRQLSKSMIRKALSTRPCMKKKSFNRNSANHRLYHALMEALIEDENAMHKGVADTVKDHKRKHDDDNDDDEDPPAGLNQGKKTKRRRTKESESSKKPSTTKETRKGKAPSKGSKSSKYAFIKEPVDEPFAEVVMDDAGEDVVRDDDWKRISTKRTKTKPKQQNRAQERKERQKSPVADEAASTCVDVRYGGATTTVTGLEVGQGSGNIDKTLTMPHDSPLLRVKTLGSDEGSMTLQELMVLCETLSKKVESLETDLQQTKLTYGAAYTKLIKKVKKLENKVNSSQARRRARIIVSDDEDNLEDPSKQGRKIAEIDQDPTISLVQHDAKIQGRHEHDMEFNFDLDVAKDVSTAKIVSTAGAVVTTASVAAVSTASPTRRVSTIDDITMAETLVYIRKLSAKDKAVRLQTKLEEEDRQRITRVHKAAISFNVEEWEDIQARVKADEELAQRLQTEEREMYTKAEQARMLVELINQRKGYFATQKAKEKRNKPPTQAQQRTYMSNYIKHIGGYTLQQLRGYSFDEIKNLFEIIMRRVHTFVPIESEIERVIPELAAGSSKRDAEEELDQESSKRQKTVLEQGMNVEALQTKYPIIDWEIYTEGIRKYKHIHDLTWRLYDSCGVYHVSTDKGIDIYMLVEKKYPLSRGTLTQMLVAKLLVDQDNEMSKELLRKIFMQAERPRR
ncbi:hypothetical protein Tco_1557094 [Tanacetum coccineum]